ncbi:unnamed protein product, partial [Brassica oleracea var. botrytis]
EPSFHPKSSLQVHSHNLIHFFLATLYHPPHSLLLHLHRLPLVPNFQSFNSNAYFLINSFFSHTIFTGSSYTHDTSSLIFFTSADTPSPLPCLIVVGEYQEEVHVLKDGLSVLSKSFSVSHILLLLFLFSEIWSVVAHLINKHSCPNVFEQIYKFVGARTYRR